MTAERRQLLLGVDVGTTHCKAALFTMDGAMVRIAKKETPAGRQNGLEVYEPERMWETIASLIREAAGGEPEAEIAAAGITGMAESGLLVGRSDGRAHSPFIPWYSPCSQPHAVRIAAEGDPEERFAATGLRSSYKYGLAKLLYIRDADPHAAEDAVWLSAPDYIAYRLTGAMATDYTLAARTFAFRIDRKAWDAEWLRSFGFDRAMFPAALPGGAAAGRVTAETAAALGLPAGIPVTIAGHDHVCAALAAGAVKQGTVLDSMGTAETLVGMLPERALNAADYRSGLSFGLHLTPDALFWMGGNSASGGSVEWLRGLLSEPQLTYGEVMEMLESADPGPTGILYYPYLAGSTGVQPNARAKAAFIGLQASHGRGDLLKAALEGTAYEIETIRREAELLAGAPIRRLNAVGGGTNNRRWLQIKADVSGCTIARPASAEGAEAALLGAALLAGVACGRFAGAAEAAEAVQSAAAAHPAEPEAAIVPDAKRHRLYRELYAGGYAQLQQPLRTYYTNLEGWRTV